MPEQSRVAGFIQARTGSVRCRNKMLRPFGDTNLIRLALSKYADNSVFPFYFAAHEPELLEVGRDYGCSVIERNRASAEGEQIEIIMNYLPQMDEEYVMFINPCCPFMTLHTLSAAVTRFNAEGARSMTAVTKTHTWYYHENGQPINFLDPTIPNTKFSTPLLAVTHAFHIFDKQRFLDHHYFWTHETNDPYFYEMPDEEAIDIDTELDFEVASALYEKRLRLQ